MCGIAELSDDQVIALHCSLRKLSHSGLIRSNVWLGEGIGLLSASKDGTSGDAWLDENKSAKVGSRPSQVRL